MQKTLRASDLSNDEALPDLDVPTTATLVVGGAIASRDYTPVHHSASEAQAQGLPDVFMNILTTQGICSRYLTDWAGPDAVIKSVKTKLGGPNLPGDTLKLRGKVVSTDGNRADVEITGTTSWGNHVTATFTLELPS